MNTIHLQQNEIIELTGYKKPTFQLKFLKELGIQAKKRQDNTICVLRRDCTQFPANDAALMPKLKSAR